MADEDPQALAGDMKRARDNQSELLDGPGFDRQLLAGNRSVRFRPLSELDAALADEDALALAREIGVAR